MCGILGLWQPDRRDDAAGLQAALGAMAGALARRGPDGEGLWLDAGAGIGLGHRRLSIIDVSDAGSQPMASASGRFVITYNGEVYNFPSLRRELEARGCRFRGRSDTEVVLEACEAWGVEAALERLIGMFAFALWDREERCLHLARDRLGVKPLYLWRQGTTLLFASQPAALLAHPAVRPVLDREAVAAYLRHNFVPAPLAIWQGMSKLPPAHLLTVGAGGAGEERCYWDVAEVAARAALDPLDLDDAEATEQLDRLLRDAVAGCMISDVPVGAFLSGGIDSSTVAALMQAQSAGPVRTFSIGFADDDYDESRDARRVAAHLGTRHEEQRLDPGDVLAEVPDLAAVYDEPFADASQLPTLLVSRLARRQVTVALSGDGGDEGFAGYNRHAWAERLHRAAPVPRLLRHAAAEGILAVSPASWSRLVRLAPAAVRPRRFGDKMHKLATVLDAGGSDEIHRRLLTQWDPPPTAGRTGAGGDRLWAGEFAARLPDPLLRMQVRDFMRYLPDDILAKVDRASMAVSLEARVPLLDHRVVEFALRLPRHQKLRDGRGKWLLRQVLHRYVPPDLVERPKSGFGVPIGAWLRGPLRELAEDLLSPSALAADDLLDPAPIRRRWQQHLAGERDWQHPLWGVLMLQLWRRRWSV